MIAHLKCANYFQSIFNLLPPDESIFRCFKGATNHYFSVPISSITTVRLVKSQSLY